MPLSDKHPSYVARLPDWLLMRDAWEGERIIKEKQEKYLPPTRAMRADGMKQGEQGHSEYQDYIMRAVYHDIVKPSIEAMLGILHSGPPTIELPPQLDDMRDHCTFNGESIEQLLVRVNEQQLLVGRLGGLLDVADGAAASDMPYIVLYNAETINNWDTSRVYDDSGPRKLQFVVLNETGLKRNAQLSWVTEIRYRVLADASAMADAWPGIVSGLAGANYVVAEADKMETVPAEAFRTPSLGGTGLEAIPFQFIGPRDLMPDPDKPPLLGLARLALAIYRGEADYRESIHQQAGGTLALMGVSSVGKEGTEQRLGPGNIINLPLQGDAKYVGAGHECLDPMLDSIKADEGRAAALGASMLDQKGNAAESGDALTIRSAARTCTLNTIACAAAGGVENLLRSAAIWVGADPDKVSVEPNLEFDGNEETAQDLNQLMMAKVAGAPICKRSIHGWMVDNAFTRMTYEDEQKELDKDRAEDEANGLGGTPGLAGVPGLPAPVVKPVVKPAAKPVVKPAPGK